MTKKIFLLCCFAALSLLSRAQDHNAFFDVEMPRLVKLYEHLHANPELSFMEKNTSARLAQELKAAGFEVSENIGGYGVVAVLKNGTGKTLLIRADMDGLPIKEETGLPYASKVIGKDREGRENPVMHGCGHDLHVTVLAGLAQRIAQLKKQWKGTLILVGQPAEERVGGASAMLEAGLYKQFGKPDYCVALHASANLPAGKVGYCPDYALANVNTVDITIFGESGHGAYPHLTKDPIVLASSLIMQLQTIVSRQTSPLEPCVVTVGSIHGGSKHNIIPDEVKLQLTLRSYSPQVRENTIAAIQRIMKGLAMAAGLPEHKYPVMSISESASSTYNTPDFTLRLAETFGRAIGKENVIKVPPVMAAEDFGLFGESAKVPSCLYWLGAVNPAQVAESEKTSKPLPSLHSSLFAPLPAPTIRTGIQTMTATVLDLLK